METYIQKLRRDVREHKIIFEQDGAQPCLDALWWHYSSYHHMDSDNAKAELRSLRTQLEGLPMQDSDMIFTDILCLCAEYERIAFAAGLRLGAQLMLEIQDS